MKKIVALFLVLALGLSLCSCGGSKITEADIREAVSDSQGTLTIESAEEYVTAFNYVVKGVNADDLVNKEFTRKALDMLANDPNNSLYGQYLVSKATTPLMSIDMLLRDVNPKAKWSPYVEEILGVISDGKSLNGNGWTISAEIDQSNDSITIHAVYN